MAELSDDARRNRESWAQANAEHTDARASAAWAEEEITWGVFSVPEASPGTPGDVGGFDVVELGCGTAYVSDTVSSADGSRSWPAEEIWVAAKPS